MKKQIYLPVLFIAMITLSCSKTTKSNEKADDGITLSNMDSTVLPGNDFIYL